MLLECQDRYDFFFTNYFLLSISKAAIKHANETVLSIRAGLLSHLSLCLPNVHDLLPLCSHDLIFLPSPITVCPPTHTDLLLCVNTHTSVSSLQWGLLRRSERCWIPASWRWLPLRSSVFKLQGVDLTADAKAAQLFSVREQLLSLRET